MYISSMCCYFTSIRILLSPTFCMHHYLFSTALMGTQVALLLFGDAHGCERYAGLFEILQTFRHQSSHRVTSSFGEMGIVTSALYYTHSV